MTSQAAGKLAAGRAAAARVHDGQTLGLGTGSTVVFFLDALGERIAREGLRLRGVATSDATARRARELGVEIVALTPHTRPDLTVDGADEVSPKLDLIKGAGGALVREKLVAQASRDVLIIADSSKAVATLGAFPLSVAVVPFAAADLIARLRAEFEVDAVLRVVNDGAPLVTDDGLNILDLPFQVIRRPALLEKRLKILTGVVESGLFVGIAKTVLLGHPDGHVEELVADTSE